MTFRQVASGIVAAAILILALIWVSALAYYALTTQVDYLGSDGEPQLYFIWKSLRWIVDGGAVGPTFAGFLALVGVGSQALSGLHRNMVTLLPVVTACLLGILACVIVMIVTGEQNGSVIRSLRSVGGDEAALRGAIRLFMGGLVVWFVTFMATQLRISIVSEGGAVRAYFRRQRERRSA